MERRPYQKAVMLTSDPWERKSPAERERRQDMMRNPGQYGINRVSTREDRVGEARLWLRDFKAKGERQALIARVDKLIERADWELNPPPIPLWGWVSVVSKEG